MRHQCIAISGKSGCGNTTVSRQVADRLGFSHINYTFRNMAAEMEIPLQDLLVRAAADSHWDRELDRHQVKLAALEDSVMGSRLAIWLMRGKAFTVYLDAAPELRAGRIGGREGKPLEQALAETVARDEGDRLRYLDIYGIDVDDWGFADLVLDAGSLTVEEEVERIVAAFAARGGKRGCA
jgi:cytidylate kinase